MWLETANRDDESSQNPPGRRRLSPNSRNRAIELFTSALARFGLGSELVRLRYGNSRRLTLPSIQEKTRLLLMNARIGDKVKVKKRFVHTIARVYLVGPDSDIQGVTA